MTQTTNIGLKKIDGSENWRQIFDYHNDSADKTDSAVAAVQDGLAIVANGNTHAAVAEGQFVYVRNHSTLAEGLYKASSAIGTNATLSTSNLTADGSGGLNNLQEQVTSLNRKLVNRLPYVAIVTQPNNERAVTITLSYPKQMVLVMQSNNFDGGIFGMVGKKVWNGSPAMTVTDVDDSQNIIRLSGFSSYGGRVYLLSLEPFSFVDG